MPVAVQQSDVPIKLNIEAGAGLFLWRGSMTEKHVQINFRTLSQRAKPRRLILNLVRRQNPEVILHLPSTYFRHCIASASTNPTSPSTPCKIVSSPARHLA